MITHSTDWTAVPFGDLVISKDAQRVPLKESDRATRQGNIPYYGASGVIDHIDDHLFEGTHLLVAEDGANLLSRSTPVAFTASGQFWVNNHAHVLLPKPDVELRFLLHFLACFDLEPYVSGTAQPKLTYSNLARVPVPLPPLAEQRRIAAVLDHAEALRTKRRVALAELDTLIQSLFIDLFGDTVSNPKGWPLVPFPSVIYFQEGPGVRNWQFRTEGIKLINVRNIVDGQLEIGNSERFLDPVEVEQRYKHFLLDAGDLVVASSGVTWGKIAEVEEHHLPLCLNTSVIRLRPFTPDIEKRFIRAFVESPLFRQQILRLITGSAQPNFGPAHLKQLRIPLPPVSLQREFACRVAAVQNLEMTQRAALTQLNDLFASLQHRAFRGEL